MKKIKLYAILTLVLSLGLLTSGCHVMGLNYESVSIDDEKIIELADVSAIEINSVSSDINIIFENRDDILATYVGEIRTAKKDYYPELTVSESSRKIHIWIEYPKSSIYLDDINTVLTVYLPESYSDDLTIGSVSGDITVNKSTLTFLECGTVSGKILGDGITSDRSKFNTVSGNVEMDGFASNNVDATTVSGDIILEIPENYDLSLDTNTVSGDVSTEDGHASDITENISIDASTVSGDITITRY